MTEFSSVTTCIKLYLLKCHFSDFLTEKQSWFFSSELGACTHTHKQKNNKKVLAHTHTQKHPQFQWPWPSCAVVCQETERKKQELEGNVKNLEKQLAEALRRQDAMEMELQVGVLTKQRELFDFVLQMQPQWWLLLYRAMLHS